MTKACELKIPQCRFCGRVIHDFHARSCRLSLLRVHANHTVQLKEVAAAKDASTLNS